MTMVAKAIEFVKRKHEGQFRKGSGEPYYTHPLAVSYIVAAKKSSKKLEELIVAAILHDTLEDTETTFSELTAEFSPLVASLVLELTNDPEQIKEIGKLEYQKRKMVGMSSYGLLIKLADRLHNLSDSPTSKTVEDSIALIAHIQQNRVLTKSHGRLIEDIEIICRKLKHMVD
jgi:(p)ppGpp synthase/HD superfamily hydrolase